MVAHHEIFIIAIHLKRSDSEDKKILCPICN